MYVFVKYEAIYKSCSTDQYNLLCVFTPIFAFARYCFGTTTSHILLKNHKIQVDRDLVSLVLKSRDCLSISNPAKLNCGLFSGGRTAAKSFPVVYDFIPYYLVNFVEFISDDILH